MSDIEKRKLSVELSELQGDQLSRVLEVLQVRVGVGWCEYGCLAGSAGV